MRQIKVGLTDDLRRVLNERAKAAGHPISKEMRILLWAGLATMTTKPINIDLAREMALTHAAWVSAGPLPGRVTP